MRLTHFYRSGALSIPAYRALKESRRHLLPVLMKIINRTWSDAVKLKVNFCLEPHFLPESFPIFEVSKTHRDGSFFCAIRHNDCQHFWAMNNRDADNYLLHEPSHFDPMEKEKPTPVQCQAEPAEWASPPCDDASICVGAVRLDTHILSSAFLFSTKKHRSNAKFVHGRNQAANVVAQHL